MAKVNPLQKWTVQVLFLIFTGPLLGASSLDYWQQKVSYDIKVTLDDKNHWLSGTERIQYINNSPDTLTVLWMHLWPNAYSGNNTPLAREKFKNYSTRMYFWEDEDFGWITLDSVSSQGQAIPWEYRSEDSTDVARFDLWEPLVPGDSIVIQLGFKLKLPSSLSRLAHIGQHYEFTQWYPKPAVYDESGWHAMSYLEQGEFYSEWADYRVEITLPELYRVAATGVLQEHSERVWRDSLAHIGNEFIAQLNTDRGTTLPESSQEPQSSGSSDSDLKTISFYQPNVHDFAWFADKTFMISKDTVTITEDRDVVSWTYFLPENASSFRLSNHYAARAIQDFSDWFREYPYESITIVDGDDSRGGGMEYPMITLINAIDFQPIMEVSIVHEIAHNWFYGLLGTNEREHPWIDEGFTTYAENRYWRTHYPGNEILSFYDPPPKYVGLLDLFLRNGTKSALSEMQYYKLAKPHIDQAPGLPSEELSRMNYWAMTYNKTGLATETLHDYLGVHSMDRVWARLFAEWAFKHPGPSDIREIFEQESQQNLSWYFDDIIGSNRKIDYGLKKIESREQNQHNKVQLLISNFGNMAPPLSIGLRGPTGQIDSLHWMQPTMSREIVQIETDFPISDIQLDPYNKLLDMDRRNNRLNRQLDLDFMKFDLNPDGNYVINTIPYVWYSSVNGLIPGIIVSHDDLIDWGGIDWYTRSSLGRVSKTIGMIASIGKTIYPGSGRKLSWNSRYGRDWYYNLIELNGSFSREYPFSPRDVNQWQVSYTDMDITSDGKVFGGDTTFALDPNVWTHDHSYRFELDHKRSIVHTLSRREYGATFGMGDGHLGRRWAKFQAFLTLERRHHKHLQIHSTFYLGFMGGNSPGQERFYLSTNMDPGLKDGLVLDRNDAWYAPGHFQLYTTPYTLPGFLFDKGSQEIPRTEALLGAKTEIDHSRLLGFKLLLGTGILKHEITERMIGYASGSLVYDIGPWRLYLTPLTMLGKDLSVDPLRFQLYFEMPTGGGFLGL